MQIVGPLIGGALIGGAASLLWLSHGRAAGISGFISSALGGEKNPVAVPFLVGMLAAGVMLRLAFPDAFGAPKVGLVAVAVAGLAVGFGSRLGGGCTSGHGVCGISKLSTRSVVATVTFMATGALAALLVRLVG